MFSRWAIYTGKYYTYKEDGTGGTVQILPTIEGNCIVPDFQEQELGLGSARIIGSHSNNSVPSVTIFSSLSLQGAAMSFEDKLSTIKSLSPNFDRFEVHSLVTINTMVEFFQLPNFEGESICVQEANMDGCIDGVCWLWWFNDDLPWDIAFAQSARLGCSDSAQRVLPSQKARASTKGMKSTVMRQF